jgi:hypothetical protein
VRIAESAWRFGRSCLAVKILFFSLPGPASAGSRRLGNPNYNVHACSGLPSAWARRMNPRLWKNVHAHAHTHARTHAHSHTQTYIHTTRLHTHTYHTKYGCVYTNTRLGWTWIHICGLPGAESSGPVSSPSPCPHMGGLVLCSCDTSRR